MASSTEPVLDVPGAGLPAPELFVARLLFSLKRRLGSRDSFSGRFEAERAAIRRIVAAVPGPERGRRILIPRLRGLEDSSRFWSVWMTLDHLRITNRAFSGVISTLAKGQLPPGVASTATVKPLPDSGVEVETSYEQSCDDLLEAVSRVGDLKTSLRYEHPWFGPLDGAGWHALSATHLGIHRAQIEAIRRRLAPGDR